MPGEIRRRNGRKTVLGADPDRLDPVLAHRLDPQRVAVDRDRVAAFGQPPELAEDEAADRVVGVGVGVGQVDARVLEVAEADVPAHEPVAVGEPPDRRGARVGLVLDLPHHLLEDVLDGDDPDRPPVLVDHHRERGALHLQVVEEVVERPRLRHDQGVADHRLDRRLRALAHVEPGEAVVVDDAADPVGVLVLDHHQAGVAGGDAAAQRRLDRLVVVDRDHRRDRRHHLARLLLVEVEDAAEHPRLAGVEAALLGPAGDDQAELLGRGFVGVLGVDPQHPLDQQDRRDVGGDDQRAQDAAEEDQRPGDPDQRLLGQADRDHLRRLLAEDHLEEGDDDEGEGDRQRQRDRVGGEAAEDRFEQMGERGLAEEADAERGDRDPDLAGGDELVDPVELFERPRRPAHALVAHLLEPRPARAHDGELGGDEEAVDRNQQQQ